MRPAWGCICTICVCSRDSCRNVAYQVNEPQTLLALVAEGCGITLLPDSYGRIPWPGVRFCSLQQAPPADLYAVYRADSVTPVVQAFLERLRAP
ncbi:LysR substrate-binding domain-containing protein [Serratia marcescens]